MGRDGALIEEGRLIRPDAAADKLDGDDELAILMPSLMRCFQEFERDENLNFMGAPDVGELTYCGDNNKENAISDRHSFRQFKRRVGSGRVTTSRPIDFRELFAKENALHSPPSGSLYTSVTTALKENVNKAGLDSQNVDDFWSTERQRKISAVARRKLTGVNVPEQSKPQPAEDRHTRHARSRRGGGNSRKLGARPIKLDLFLDAARISEWDHEALAVEEEDAVGSSCAFISVGRPILKANLSALDDVKNCAVRAGASEEACREMDHHDKTPLQEGSDDKHPCDVPQKADSVSSLLDMDWSSDQSAASKKRSREEHYESVNVSSFTAGNTLSNGNISAGEAGVDQGSTSCPVLSQYLRGSGDDQAQKIGNEGPTLMNLTHEEDPSTIPLEESSPILNREIETRSPVTSPTPPYNPLAVHASLRCLGGDTSDLCQRRLAFLSSPSDETGDTGGWQDDKLNLDSDDVDSLRDLRNAGTYQMTATKGNQVVQELQRSETSPMPLHDGVTSHKDDDINNDLLVQELQTSEEISCRVSCDDATINEDDDEQDDLLVDELKQSKDISRTASCEMKIHAYGNHNEVETVQEDEVDMSERHLCRAVEDDRNSRQNKISSSHPVSISQAGSALLAISQEYQEEDHVDEVVPDVDEGELLHAISKDASQPEQTVPTREAENLEEMDVEIGTLIGTEVEAQLLPEQLKEAAESKGILQASAQHNVPPEQGVKRDSHDLSEPMPNPKRVRRKKLEERRSSLEDAGSIWKDGQRRSQRRHVRPLEWWRGEKLLYGRLHTTLSTIIGIKHSSPGKYARGVTVPLKVESYLPAKYNDLVRQAAI